MAAAAAAAAGESAGKLLLRAAALVPPAHYALAALVLASAFLYRFLELHFLGDLLRGFRGGRVALTFHPDSHIYHRVASKCRSLHGRYLATPWLASPHLQTLFLSISGRPPLFTYKRQLYTVRDGGTIALDWLLASDCEAADVGSSDGIISKDDSTPLVVVIPGLTSDSTAAYVKHLVFSMARKGWNVVVSNHRGLGGISITSDCFYNAGWTEDIREVVSYLHQKYPEAPLFTVGTSIGANILVKYLGEEGESTPVAGAASICSPWDLLVTNRFISRKLVQRCYDRALAIGLKGYAKLHQPVLARLANWEAIRTSRSIREFDHHATCVVAQYETVDTFYRRCSSANYIGNVSVPLLCISALDDPLCTREAIPWDECRANKNVVLATTTNGGHLAFFQGLTAGRLWWVEPVSEFLAALHDSPYMHRQKTQGHGLHSSLESSIDKGPYVNFMEDGMVAVVTDEAVDIDDSLGNQIVSETELSDGMVDVQQNGITTVLHNECHSEVKNKSSSEDDVSPVQGPVGLQEQREELYTDKIQDAIAPVRKSINQLARSQGRFMNRKGGVVERLLGVEHVKDTTSASLKRSLDKLFATHNLSMSRLRGQGYDGASNMRGELNGLKKLVLDDNPQAFYVHCFAHQLQLVVVAVVKGVLGVSDFFGYAKRIVNMVSASCKRNDDLLQKHHDNLVLQLETGQIFAGIGKHQETSLARPGDTRWGTHHRTLIRFLQMWDSVIEVLQAISEDGGDADERSKASGLIKTMDVFEFVFILHVMLRVLGLTNDLSQALQLKDQNIVSAMNMIESVKSLLQQLRDDGWEPLLEEVTTFCVAKEIPVPDMNDNITARGYARSSRKVVTCLHYYKVQIFNEVIDRNLGEMNHRFSETSTQLLRCVACLDPRESFKSFDRQKLVELASMYPHDFCPEELHLLNDQLLLYIDVMRKSPDFLSCNSLSGLAIKMVETGEHATYAWVYRLITLALILPVATASVERVFSAMNIIKTNLRNKMNDGWLNDMMICYVERDIFAQTDDKEIAKHFHGKKNRRGHLPGPPHLLTTT